MLALPMADETIRDAIKQTAQDPKSAQADGVRVDSHPIRDLIEADRYLTQKEAANGTGLPIRIHKIRSGPPGGGAR